MTKRKETPRLVGVLHMLLDLNDDADVIALCGHVVTGHLNGHWQTSVDYFLSRTWNADYSMYIHCHWCEEELTDFDIINATDV